MPCLLVVSALVLLPAVTSAPSPNLPTSPEATNSQDPRGWSQDWAAAPPTDFPDEDLMDVPEPSASYRFLRLLSEKYMILPAL